MPINYEMKSLFKSSKFYVTTPIYYVNASPHIGHLYTSLIADASQRWQQLITPSAKIVFATGTDEHGSKIQHAALKNKATVEKYCDQISSSYKRMSDNFAIGYTNFIRTTDEVHITAVQEFWKTLNKNGFIYSSKYSGWYCVSDETFLSEMQLKETVNSDGTRTLVSLDSGHPVEWTEEQNYMFSLSKFQQNLMDWLSKNDSVVKPKKYQKILWDMISNEELADVSISRPSSRVHWGVKVPDDETQTVYVWLDALVNYLTVAGYPNIQNAAFNGVWPPDVQVIGKDILKFHGIYWPAFLLAANLELPKSLLCHSHWTVDDEKMSKSKNNVICPFNRSALYTSDGLRYFLLREGVAHSDGNYSDVKVTRILNSELADTLGNLLSRCCSLALNPNQVFPEIDSEAFERVVSIDVTKKVIEAVMKLPDVCEQHYSEFNFYKVVDATIATLHIANLFFETLKPWELKKNPETLNQLNVVLHITMETLRICSIIMSPIIPNLSEQILSKMCVSRNKRAWIHGKSQSWNDRCFQEIKLSKTTAVIFQRIGDERKKKSRL
ncbi:hypothetical protein RI129_006150 [Pyrocoelia pectoralis]|uniref:Methionine--tRNA ligase, mitochondrial n=1 Tax=Pyrocoelia pectoralis TaxID=417401 RepID=A0AAN7VAQ0_9COLE